MKTSHVLAATTVLLLLLAASTQVAVAQSGAARLQGTFSMSGRVTAAVHVKGEHRGQQLTRSWSFVPLCPAGPCGQVQLIRQRAGGTDTLTLQSGDGISYSGSGSFIAPLLCRGRVHAAGQTVPFTITLQIAAATTTSTGQVATAIAATYTNNTRVNHTRCVLPPSHDAAVYSGSLQGPAPSARRAVRRASRAHIARSPRASLIARSPGASLIARSPGGS